MMQTLPEQLGLRILIQLAQIIGSKNEPPKTATLTAKPAMKSEQQRILANNEKAYRAI